MTILYKMGYFSRKTRGILRHVWLLFFKIVLENTENTILMFFENYSYSLNLVFTVFSVFFKKKKKKRIKCVLFIFLALLVFQIKKLFSKIVNKHAQRCYLYVLQNNLKYKHFFMCYL